MSLIDSILRGIPIPKIYLTQEFDHIKQKTIHYVIDGQQRIKAIQFFLQNKYSITINNQEFSLKI
ncbi:MAG: DUF262 domain-containing protein [Promethearchaeota archaeon]